MVTTKRRASNAKLAPGESSIDRVVPVQLPDGSWEIQWSLRLLSGDLVRRRSRGPSKGEARRRAHETEHELLTNHSSTWKLRDSIRKYLDVVTKPALDKAHLRPNSHKRYLLAFHQLREALGTTSIANATRFRSLEKALQTIAHEHGKESARQAKTVLSKYVLQQMIRDELITGNPLARMAIDISSDKPTPPRAERSLTRDELKRAIEWLLHLDPADGVGTQRGRGGAARYIAVRRNLIDLTLLQASTGLRVSEANSLTWNDFDTSVDVKHSKTGRGRKIPILFDPVIEHLTKRKELGGTYVIGSPVDPTKQWDRDNCRKHCSTFYPEIGKAINCADVFNHGRTHLWRKTINTLMLHEIPDVTRAAFFGHTVAVNQDYYTDSTDITPVREAGARLWEQ